MNFGLRASWRWLLGLYTIASFLETVFWGQMTAFTPIFLRDLGMDQSQIPAMVGIIAAVVGAAGIPFLPFWGALADRYSRQPMVVRSFVVYLFAGMISVLAGNVWVFVIGRSLMSLSLGTSGLMLTTLAERTPTNRHGLAFAGLEVNPLEAGQDRMSRIPWLAEIDLHHLVAVACAGIAHLDRDGDRAPGLEL